MQYVWIALAVLAPGALAVWLVGGTVTTTLGVLAVVGGGWATVRWRGMSPRPLFGLWRVLVFGLGASFVICGSIAIGVSRQDAQDDRQRVTLSDADRQKTVSTGESTAPAANAPGAEQQATASLKSSGAAPEHAAPTPTRDRKQWPMEMGWADAEVFLRGKGYLTVAAAEEEPSRLRGNDRRCTNKEDCESVQPEIDFDYSKQGDPEAPRCVTVFHVKPIDWRAIITEFTGGAGSMVPKAKGKSPRLRTIAGASGMVNVVTYPDESMVSMGPGCDLDGVVHGVR